MPAVLERARDRARLASLLPKIAEATEKMFKNSPPWREGCNVNDLLERCWK
jgi:hypothetical protein